MSEQKRRLVLVAALISKPDPPRMLLTRHTSSRLWHFPDGEPIYPETLVETIRRSLKEDFRVVPAEIEERDCMPTETIKAGKNSMNILTLHFVVRLPVGLQLLPQTGVEIYWHPVDPCCHSNLFPLLSSTAEIFRLLNEDD